MIEIFCGAVHHREGPPCAECRGLYEHACLKIDRCPHGRVKPVCAACTIHCYSAEQRNRIRTVMRFSGPRMLWRHPVLALLHILDGLRGTRIAAAPAARGMQS
jgi:hypothetical protein